MRNAYHDGGTFRGHLLEPRCAFGKMYSIKGLQSKSAPRLKYSQLTEAGDRCHVRDDRR